MTNKTDDKVIRQRNEDLGAMTDDEVDKLSTTLNIEELGRQRPAVFTSAWMEIAFVASMLGALGMAVCLMF